MSRNVNDRGNRVITANAECHIAGLLLAAGSSTRAGSINKLFYVKNQSVNNQAGGSGISLVVSSAQTLLRSGISTIVAVTGGSHRELAMLLQPLGVNTIQNPDFKLGIGTSLRVGLSHLLHAEAVLVCLGDMPDVKTSTLKTMFAVWQKSSRDNFIVPQFRGRRGNPVLIPRCFYAEFERHGGDIGARVVMQQHPKQVLTCPVDDPAVLADYDTQAQLVQAGWVAPLQITYEEQ